MNLNDWINFDKYSVEVVVLALCGAVFWVSVYLFTIRIIISKKWVEMPVYVACGNIVWEFLWGFVFYEQIDMGKLFIYSYRIWFILDVYIFISIYRYSYKQIENAFLRQHAKKLVIGLTAMWFILLYAFIATGVDAPFGAQSSYILNLGISTLYILMWLRLGNTQSFSRPIAFCKMIGTAFYTVFFAVQFPGNYFVPAIGSVIFILDLTYTFLLVKGSGLIARAA
ncbi:MAG: hypothetical protein GC180_11990 [Bacteroidetes bacterium]|nr:hypothetical protein [Bacteroidota bacterium]